MPRLRLRETSFFVSDYAQAFYETAFIWGFSTLVPILFLWLIGAITNNEHYFGWIGFLNAFQSFFISTEIFIYVTALLAPTVSFMIFHWRARRHANFYGPLFLLIMLILLCTVVIYALEKAGVHLNSTVVDILAWGAYIIVLLIWYLAHWYEKRLPKLLGSDHHQSGDSVMSALGR